MLSLNTILMIKQHKANFGLKDILMLVAPELIILFGIFLLIGILGINYQTNKVKMIYIMNKTNYYTLIIIFWLLLIPFSFSFINDANDFKSIHILLFQDTFSINFYTQLIKIIVVTVLIIIIKYYNFTSDFINAGELLILIQISLLLIFTIISCRQYAILLLALEGFSLALYILATINRLQGSIMAAAKYFVFGTLGSILLLWGVVHLYAISPYLTYTSTSSLLYLAIINNDIIVQSAYNFAMISVVLGLLIKLGSAPLHQWVPDVYDGVHLVITAYFTTVVKLIVFVIFCIIAIFSNSNIITIFAISSLIIGSFITLRQTQIKRFLAYSSIAHVGFLLIGDLPASYIYMITYLCSSLLFFSILLTVTLNGKELIYLSDLCIIKKSGWWAPFALIVSLSSMAGLPPFAGFFGKYLIWINLVEDILLYNNIESYILLLISIGLTLITIYYYVRLAIYIYIASDIEPVLGVEIRVVNSWLQVSLCVITVFWIFLQPKILSVIYGLSIVAINL